jgi:hypothetical protein
LYYHASNIPVQADHFLIDRFERLILRGAGNAPIFIALPWLSPAMSDLILELATLIAIMEARPQDREPFSE